MAVTGSRAWPDPEYVWWKLDLLVEITEGDISVAVGDCPSGVDAAVKLWSEMTGFEIKRYEADWDSFGKAAGPKRNEKMLIDHEPGLLLAFFAPPPAKNKGTNDCVLQARRFGIEVWDYYG